MVRRFAVCLAAFSLIGVMAPHANAAEDQTICSIAGSVAPAPGVAYAPQSGTYQLQGTMDCADAGHGTMTGTGTGTIGCFGGESTATLTVAWDGNKTSTMKVQLGDFTYGTGGFGTVDDGLFKGGRVWLGWGRYAAAAEMRCATGAVKSYEFAGGVMIG